VSGIGALLGRHDLDRNESGRRPHPAGFGGAIVAINLGGCMTSVPYRWLRLHEIMHTASYPVALLQFPFFWSWALQKALCNYMGTIVPSR
jgi:hypothetical protein